jgi:tripartite-type tricarboxylate transporter receptor subunit TctC
VPAESKINTLDDFIKYAKEHPKAATVGGSGSNTANHLETLHLAKLADIQVTYIPHTGTGAVVPALLGGHITAAMNYSMVAVQYKDQVKSLAVAADERLEMLPDVPTFKELGYDIVGGAYRGIAAPKGTSPKIIEKLAKAFTDVNKVVAPKQVPLGFVMTYASGEQAAKVVERMKQNYEGIIKEIMADKNN